MEAAVLYPDCCRRFFRLPLNPRCKLGSSADSGPAKTAPQKGPKSKHRETERRKKATSKADPRDQRREAIVPVNLCLEWMDVPPSMPISHQKTVAYHTQPLDPCLFDFRHRLHHQPVSHILIGSQVNLFVSLQLTDGPEFSSQLR